MECVAGGDSGHPVDEFLHGLALCLNEGRPREGDLRVVDITNVEGAGRCAGRLCKEGGHRSDVAREEENLHARTIEAAPDTLSEWGS